MSTQSRLNKLMFFGAAAEAMVRHAEEFPLSLVGVAGALTVGALMVAAQSICMFGGRVIDEVLPPSATKLSKNPSLLIGYAMTVGMLFTNVPSFMRGVTNTFATPLYTKVMGVPDNYIRKVVDFESGSHKPR